MRGSYGWEIPDLFLLGALVGAIGGLLYALLYHLIGKRFERELAKKLDEAYPFRWNKGDSQQDMHGNMKSIDSIMELNAKFSTL